MHGQTRVQLVRDARDLEGAGQFAGAVELYDRALESGPDDPEVLYLRANARYRAGRAADSLQDFDRVVVLRPSSEPQLWQRGIAQYQVGRYAECAAQFELHRTVNSDDVENAAWHFLCVARADGVEVARQELLPVGRDARVPMAEIYELFAGRAERTAVLRAAERQATADGRSNALFYAHLYLGLFAEAQTDVETAQGELRAAVLHDAGSYMMDVARLHLSILEASQRKEPAPD
jgi:lipoprotein NlpI